jgi:hypothetical protein
MHVEKPVAIPDNPFAKAIGIMGTYYVGLDPVPSSSLYSRTGASSDGIYLQSDVRQLSVNVPVQKQSFPPDSRKLTRWLQKVDIVRSHEILCKAYNCSLETGFHDDNDSSDVPSQLCDAISVVNFFLKHPNMILRWETFNLSIAEGRSAES